MLESAVLRHIVRIVSLYSLFLISFVFTTAPGQALAEDNPKHIVFVRFNLKEEKNSAAMEGFKKMMNQNGYIEGKNITYTDFVTHKPEHKAANDVLKFTAVNKANADMFVTAGWTSVYVRSKLAKSKIPQLFAPALHTTALSMLSSLNTKPETNLTGVYLEFPPEKVLQLARRIFPKMTKYAFVYDSRIPADITFKAAYGQLNENERHGVTIYYLDLASGTDTVLQKISKMGVDAYGGSVGVMKNIETLSKIDIPIITTLLIDRQNNSFIELIKDTTILAGLYTPFESCGEQAANMAMEILDGKTPIEKITPQPAEQLTVVNLAAAKKLNQTIPFLVMEAADLVIK